MDRFFNWLRGTPLLLYVFMTFHLWCYGQETGVKPWSLKECISYAIDNNSELKIKNAESDEQLLQHRQLKKERIPELFFNTGQNFLLGRSIDPTTNLYTNDKIYSSDFNINLNIPVYQGFFLHNKIRQSEWEYNTSEFIYKSDINRLSSDVIRSYLQILLNRELVAIHKHQLAYTESEIQLKSKLEVHGKISELILDELRIQKSTEELKLKDAEVNLLNSETTLKNILNLPSSYNLVIDDTSFLIQNHPTITLNENWIEQAVISDPRVKSAESVLLSLEYNIAAARSKFYPVVSFNAMLYTGYSSARKIYNYQKVTNSSIIGYLTATPGQSVSAETEETIITSQNYPFFRQLNDNRSEFAGINITVPILNHRRYATSVKLAVVEKNKAEFRLNSLKRDVDQYFRNLINDVMLAEEKYKITVNAVSVAEKALKYANLGIIAGANSPGEYSYRMNNYLRSRSEHLSAKYDYYFKLKLMQLYMEVN